MKRFLRMITIVAWTGGCAASGAPTEPTGRSTSALETAECVRECDDDLAACQRGASADCKKECWDEAKVDLAECARLPSGEQEACEAAAGRDETACRADCWYDEAKECADDYRQCERECGQFELPEVTDTRDGGGAENDNGDAGAGQGEGEYSDPDDTACIPPMVRGPLGQCTMMLTGVEPEDRDPNDGCPAGFERGPRGDCRPVVATRVEVEAVPCGGERWCVICPPGTVPGPNENCVLDSSTREERAASCPPGTVPSEDGNCIPRDETLPIEPLMEMDLERASPEELREHGIVVTTDPVRAIEASRPAIEGLGVDSPIR